MKLAGQVALVTGGASGIGAATARHLAGLGAEVALGDVNGAAAARIAGEIGAAAFAIELDVAQAASCEAAAEAVVGRFGSLDIVVNSAGVLLDKPFLDLAPADFHRVVSVNLAGTCFVGQAAARRMLDKGGSIINIASIGGMLGYPGRAAYAASKGGVIALTRVMALELSAYRIRVNAIAPGPVDTPMTGGVYGESYRRRVLERVPLGRFGTPEDIAQAAAFLASAESSYMTGQVLVVDGGSISAGIALERRP